MKNMIGRAISILLVLALIPDHSISHETKKYGRYLVYIFNKYGSNGTMSFEGLEHLMYNLGLGQLEFGPTHTIDEHRPYDDTIANVLSLNEYKNDETTKNYIKADKLKMDQIRTESTMEDHRKNQKENHDISLSKIIDNNDLSVEETAAIDNMLVNNLIFKEMHDPNHRHPRHKDDDGGSQKSDNVCLSPKSLLRLIIDHDDIHTSNKKLYKLSKDKSMEKFFEYKENTHNIETEFSEFVNSIQITPLAFMKLCPALLVQIDQNVCVKELPKIDYQQNSLYNAWIYASVAIFILSMCGVLGITLVPLMKTVAYQEILKFLVAVAVGTLSGDALMHLLPHALSSNHSNENKSSTETEEDHNGPVWICASAFITAVFMYIVESILPFIRGADDHHHNHNHSHGNARETVEINTMIDEFKNDKKIRKPLTPVAFMVVIGDGLHNLTDGLAIGAAFASQPVTGMATAFAVFCHELPHELGDFALLLQTGVTIRRAVCLNIVSSVLSFVGMAFGLLLANAHTDMVKWIYAGTAGSFLYIAFVDLIPAMNNDGEKNLKNSLIQVIGILLGGGIMILIALNEDALRFIFE